jgi:hypothetical protein
MIDWTLAHLRLMWAFVGLIFVVMLFIPDARWNAITTVWGRAVPGPSHLARARAARSGHPAACVAGPEHQACKDNS